jgi:hypothetical protein
MPVNRKSVQMMSASSINMNKYSTELKGDSYYGYTDGYHTIQVQYSNYVGRLRIQATLVLEPTSSDWFDIVIDANNGLYAGSTPWNADGYVQFNASAPATGSEAYSFYGNFAWVRVYMDREHVGDGSTYDTSYGQISRAILSA